MFILIWVLCGILGVACAFGAWYLGERAIYESVYVNLQEYTISFEITWLKIILGLFMVCLGVFSLFVGFIVLLVFSLLYLEEYLDVLPRLKSWDSSTINATASVASPLTTYCRYCRGKRPSHMLY